MKLSLGVSENREKPVYPQKMASLDSLVGTMMIKLWILRYPIFRQTQIESGANPIPELRGKLDHFLHFREVLQMLRFPEQKVQS